MFIQTEETPNPSTLKFIPGVPVMKAGTAAYAKLEDCKNSPLAVKLFESESVKGVFFGSDFITITKSDEISWDILKAEMLAIIMDHFVSGGEVVVNEKNASKKQEVNADDSEVVKQIKELIEERVRPAVAMDGGDIIYHEFKDGVVYLEMHGACSGCPSSAVTLKSGIENMLKHYVPEVARVEAVGEVME
jgi:Fe-S cluster biogenesis protein NfuA